MWHAITYVTSPLTLVAFVAAVTAWCYTSWLKHKERQILGGIDTSRLPKTHQRELALKGIQARADRWRMATWVTVVFFVLVAAVSVLAVWRSFDEISAKRRASQEENLSVNKSRHDANMQELDKAAAVNPDEASKLTNGRERLDQLFKQQADQVKDGQWNGAGLFREQYNDQIDKLKPIVKSEKIDHIIEGPRIKKSLLEKIRDGDPITDSDQ